MKTTDNQKKRIDKGLFIVFEGIDGSGKSTQAARLFQDLEARGWDAVLTREPTDGPWGRKIRDIAAKGRSGTSLDQEIGIFVQDRREHVRQVIRPALRRGAIVICDRYYFSTIAYQGALGADPAALRRLNEKTHRFPRPDAVFYIRITPRAGIARINKKRGGANAGYEKLEFLERVAALFDAMDDPFFVRIRGAQRPAAVAREVSRSVCALISERTCG